jgi:hypothetical protein
MRGRPSLCLLEGIPAIWTAEQGVMAETTGRFAKHIHFVEVSTFGAYYSQD